MECGTCGPLAIVGCGGECYTRGIIGIVGGSHLCVCQPRVTHRHDAIQGIDGSLP